MKRLNKIIIRVYFNTFERFFECAKLYKIDLSEINYLSKKSISDDIEFFLPEKKDLPLFHSIYESNNKKLKNVEKLLSEYNYKCFAYFNKKENIIVYTRWICTDYYFSSVLNQEMHFSKNEALTLDSFSHVSYRNCGLHHNMNIDMLQWLKKNTKINTVYMIIKCFLPHLSKVPVQLGYKKIKTVFFYKKGSLYLHYNLLKKKILQNAKAI
jgi:hypothetical protein